MNYDDYIQKQEEAISKWRNKTIHNLLHYRAMRSKTKNKRLKRHYLYGHKSKSAILALRWLNRKQKTKRHYPIPVYRNSYGAVTHHRYKPGSRKGASAVARAWGNYRKMKNTY